MTKNEVLKFLIESKAEIEMSGLIPTISELIERIEAGDIVVPLIADEDIEGMYAKAMNDGEKDEDELEPATEQVSII